MTRPTGTVLTIDTATPAVTAGLVDLGGGTPVVLTERITVDPRAHAERLTPNVLAALADAGLGMGDLAAVVVGCGPGPFTGLRVGMASAAAYGDALSIPVHGVCSLDAIAAVAALDSGDILVVTDARRREVYWARYRSGVRVAGPGVAAPADVDPRSAEAVAGSAAHAALFHLPVIEVEHPTAAGLVAAVSDWSVPSAPPVPLYLRRPDAKPMAGPADGSGRSPEAVTLGPLSSDDAVHCADLEQRLFGGDDPWPPDAFRRAIAADGQHYVAARAGDRLVGYAGIARLGRRPPFEYEIHTIGVDPAYQGHGVGRRLLTDLLDFAGDAVVYLEVRTDNAVAISLYRDAGFVEAGLRKRYYRTSGSDAYTMRRDVPS